MKSINDYHLSDGALLSDIKHSLYKAPLTRGQCYIASLSLLATIQQHLETLKEDYGVPYEVVGTTSPLKVYHGLWKATQSYNRLKDLSVMSPDGCYQPSYPFLLLVAPPLNSGAFPYNIVEKALKESDPFIEMDSWDNKEEFEASIEQYNLYNATSIPTSFSCKCNIIIITDEDMTWAPEAFMGGLLPSAELSEETIMELARKKAEHEALSNPDNRPWRQSSALYNKATCKWIRPEFVETVGDTKDDGRNCYKQVFDTNEGKTVLSDLERVANQTKIDANAPDPSAAVWKCAQLALIQRVRNQIEK